MDRQRSIEEIVQLCPVEHEDLQWMAVMDSDESLVGEHNWGGDERDVEVVEQELNEAFDRDGLHGVAAGTLVVVAQSVPVGTVSWRPAQWGPSPQSRCPVFGIALLPDGRGRGYGTQAQRQLIDFLFDLSATNRVQSDTAVDNAAELAVLRKIGMKQEGVVRGAEFRDGRFIDHVLFGVTRADWETLAGQDFAS